MPADPRENRSPADGAKAKVGELSAGVRNVLRELNEQHQAIAFAGVAITVPAAASLYSKARRKKKSEGG
jgi:hypothetical protein